MADPDAASTTGLEGSPVLEFAATALDDMHTVLIERGANYADIADTSRVFTALMAALGVTRPPGMAEVEFHSISNICTKLARMTTGSRLHEDNWVDIANYAVLQLADMRRRKHDYDKPLSSIDAALKQSWGKNNIVPNVAVKPWTKEEADALIKQFDKTYQVPSKRKSPSKRK